jgi:acyl-CoA reductase-like NAD-dependent aldehyde dehydrogenase
MPEPPFVAPKITVQGIVSDPDQDAIVANVMGCCSTSTGSSGSESDAFQHQIIGKMPQMTTAQTMQVLSDAKTAWAGGTGTWPQMSLSERVQAIERFIDELGAQREIIVTTLMWEIGKNRKDSEAEFDRTVEFVQKVCNVTMMYHPN